MGLQQIYRAFRYGSPIVVVSGLPRSGTSMAMKMLDAAGLELVTDNERLADEDNPKGYFEDERIKNLEGMEDKAWLRNARGKGVKVISFLLKDLPRDNNYKVIFMRRDLDEVLASQAKMLERREEDHDIGDDDMRSMWENHLWRSNYLLKNDPAFEFIEVHYRDVLGQPLIEAGRIAAFIGREGKVDAMAGVVDKNLYRNRAS